MTKIFINPGHDIDLDSGAVNPNTGRRECDVARDAGKLLACYLQTAGCEVRTLQNDDLGLVCSESNEWGADIFVSLHCNAFNTQARGTETLYKSFNGQRLANDIQSQIIHNDEDLALLNNDLDTIVRAIARGITDFIGGE